MIKLYQSDKLIIKLVLWLHHSHLLFRLYSYSIMCVTPSGHIWNCNQYNRGIFSETSVTWKPDQTLLGSFYISSHLFDITWQDTSVTQGILRINQTEKGGQFSENGAINLHTQHVLWHHTDYFSTTLMFFSFLIVEFVQTLKKLSWWENVWCGRSIFLKVVRINWKQVIIVKWVQPFKTWTIGADWFIWLTQDDWTLGWF